ncbi:class I SAM-dependent methyltransferase [Gordonia sp. HY002]|uniref:mycofactocin oligosaccharide methyltransferase MftM n=1 Tax=Gordonia zhenghanii TaxID=2911516 RepID=UPI001EEFA400|nr:mycofactocin oligosaccharide methyltransferase MftM [Gordonia zhenghanii]MCF8570649.1 class I SAM-dependent methyltransferase [Gordonia zhenghanii]MCF8607955.1 class I SAM-dependent methyltransferase [Gordonia zhenghanii]
MTATVEARPIAQANHTVEDECSVGRSIDVVASTALADGTVPEGFTRCGVLAWQRSSDDGVVIAHPFTADSISDSTAVNALSCLVHAGVVAGQTEFESAMVGLISTSCPGPTAAWSAYYSNSVEGLRSGRADFAPVHHRALALITGTSVLEVGCCFGFFAVQCAQNGIEVHACDICPEALDLLDLASARLGVGVQTVLGDARALPHHDGSVDTVSLIHLLEHLSTADVEAAIGEALRVARMRVVIAVPFENQPSAHFGHLQSLSEDDLLRWAAPWVRSGMRATVFADHGGWLVIDKA